MAAFAIAWGYAQSELGNEPICYGNFGLISGHDGTAINKCGTSGDQACIYSKIDIASCEQQCNLIGSNVCQAFTFDPTSQTMKIVTYPNGTFTSSTVNLFIRQNNS